MLSGGGGEGHRSLGNPLIDLVRNAATGPEGSPRQLNYLRKSGEHPMSVNVLYQTSTRATAGRDGHGCRIYPQQMRGSSLELRGDSRNVRNGCICVVALSRTTEQVAIAPFFRVRTKRSFG